MTVQRFNPPGMDFPAMSQGTGCGDFVVLSGQIALKDGVVIGIGDAEAQAEQCFANIAATLAEAGLTLSDVVMLRCYLTKRDAYEGYAAVKARLFCETCPSSSTVVVQELLLDGLLMEVEAIAFRTPNPAA